MPSYPTNLKQKGNSTDAEVCDGFNGRVGKARCLNANGRHRGMPSKQC